MNIQLQFFLPAYHALFVHLLSRWSCNYVPHSVTMAASVRARLCAIGCASPAAALRRTRHHSAPSSLFAQEFVYIKRVVGDEPVEGEVYAELEKRAGDTVARLAARACTEFKRWGADAGQVRLYLVPSEERARALLRESAASDIFESGALFPGDTLERAGVKAGSYLLARVALPAAASGASCGARWLAPSLGYGASPRLTSLLALALS